MKNLSNVLAVLGGGALVVGAGMVRLAAGVIVLGCVLLLGALATAENPAEKAREALLSTVKKVKA